ncbi:MAG: tyrosine-type recombinase/integrase, partial [Bryobacteraceae bacterium]
GQERRSHRSAILGLRSELKKWEAEGKLRDIIRRETGAAGTARPDDRVTFAWFWTNRFLPMKSWRVSTKLAAISIMDRHVLPRFGSAKLREINRFDLQTFLNEIAQKYSRSLVHKARVWTGAVLEEAVEQEYLGKNPARKLVMPHTRAICKRFLTPEEYRQLLGTLAGERDRLILRLFVLCALRPGELFALRWRCFQIDHLRVEEAIYRGNIGEPKTLASAAIVSLPKSLTDDLAAWYERCSRPESTSFIFPSRNGTPLDSHNYLQRFLAPTAAKAGIPALTFQALRRTFATHFHRVGTVKDQQTQMRHSQASTSVNVYTQVVTESLRQAIERLDEKLSNELNPIEHEREEEENGSD